MMTDKEFDEALLHLVDSDLQLLADKLTEMRRLTESIYLDLKIRERRAREIIIRRYHNNDTKVELSESLKEKVLAYIEELKANGES